MIGSVYMSGAKDAFLKLASMYERGLITTEELELRALNIADACGFVPYMTAPEGVARPEKHYIHTYSDCSTVTVDMTCADDGGLFDANDPCGREFTLTDRNGLRLRILVNEFLPDKGEYRGTGTYEGYTASSGRSMPEITVTRNGEALRIGYTEDAGDADEHFSFPLWREYYDWCDDAEKERIRRAMGVFEEFTGTNPQGPHSL